MIDYTVPLPVRHLTKKRLALFASRVCKTDYCWLWLGSVDRFGYGYLTCYPLKVRVHRIAYWLANHKDPVGYLVCHTCDNKLCINPSHFFLGDNQANSADRDAKGRTAIGPTHASNLYPGTPYMKRGIAHPGSKLDDNKVMHIRQQWQAGLTQRAIAKEIGVKEITVWKVIHGKTWRHVP